MILTEDLTDGLMFFCASESIYCFAKTTQLPRMEGSLESRLNLKNINYTTDVHTSQYLLIPTVPVAYSPLLEQSTIVEKHAHSVGQTPASTILSADNKATGVPRKWSGELHVISAPPTTSRLVLSIGCTMCSS